MTLLSNMKNSMKDHHLLLMAVPFKNVGERCPGNKFTLGVEGRVCGVYVCVCVRTHACLQGVYVLCRSSIHKESLEFEMWGRE